MTTPTSGRPFVELSTGGTVDGMRVSEPVQAGRIWRRRSGSKISATSALSSVSFSSSSSTRASSTSRFSLRMSKASWWACEMSLLISSSTIAATASE